MKTISFFVLLFICHCSISEAQYIEWTTEVPAISNRGNSLLDFTVDKYGNSYFVASGQGCLSGCQFCTVSKFNSSGSGGGGNYGFTTWLYNGIAVDGNQNMILAGINYGQIPVVISGTTIPSQAKFLTKSTANGIAWVKIVNNVGQFMAADQTGNIYISDGSKIEKRNASGNMVWTNSTIGGNIQIDGKNKINVISGGNLIKLNGNNTIAWSTPIPNIGNLAVQKNGNAFVLTADSLIKYNSAGIKVWSRFKPYGNTFFVDSLGRAIISDGTNVYRLSANGNVVEWTFTIGITGISGMGADYAGNIYIVSTRSSYAPTIICPFSLNVQPMSNGLSQTQIIISKINVNSPIPFQIGIFTDKLPVVGTYGSGNYLCTGKSFSIPYSYCTNSVSYFNPGNQFVVELLGGPVSPLVVGDPSAFTIPKTIPPAYNYRLRVSSTNPYIAGYPNLPDFYNSDIRIYPTIATVTPSGNTTFCNGNSIILKATTDPIYNYAWLRNDTVIVPQGLDSIITASVNGIYKLITIDKYCGCTDTASINVSVNSLPPATITASGPLSFCAGDSVILTANSGAGLSYQWKVNNVNIPFAFYQSYKATQAGTYKVKVTNSSGCTKISSGKTVSIICKDGVNNTENSKVHVYPNPFENTFSLSFDEHQNYPVEFNIYDLMGRLFESRTITGTEGEVELGAQLEKGFYMVEISHEDEYSRVKILKE